MENEGFWIDDRVAPKGVCQWSGLRTMGSQVQIPAETKTLGAFFPICPSLVDKVTWSSLLVGGDMYPVELVKVRASWPRHHDYKLKKKRRLFSAFIHNLINFSRNLIGINSLWRETLKLLSPIYFLLPKCRKSNNVIVVSLPFPFLCRPTSHLFLSSSVHHRGRFSVEVIVHGFGRFKPCIC